jgi:hypothetical protein
VLNSGHQRFPVDARSNILPFLKAGSVSKGRCILIAEDSVSSDAERELLPGRIRSGELLWQCGRIEATVNAGCIPHL